MSKSTLKQRAYKRATKMYDQSGIKNADVCRVIDLMTSAYLLGHKAGKARPAPRFLEEIKNGRDWFNGFMEIQDHLIQKVGNEAFIAMDLGKDDIEGCKIMIDYIINNKNK